MPAEVTCNDLQKVKVTLNPNGKLDSPPVWSIITGEGTVVPSSDGLSAYLVSEDSVVGDGPFDTHYAVDALANGAPVAGDNEIVLHVMNNPAQSLGITIGQPEPK